MCGQLCRWLPLHQRTLWSKSPWKILISLVSVDQSSVHFSSPLTDFAIDTRTSSSHPQLPLKLLFFFVLYLFINFTALFLRNILIIITILLLALLRFSLNENGKWVQFLPYSAELFFKCIIKSCWKIEAMEKPREFFIMPKWDFFCCLVLLMLFEVAVAGVLPPSPVVDGILDSHFTEICSFIHEVNATTAKQCSNNDFLLMLYFCFRTLSIH